MKLYNACLYAGLLTATAATELLTPDKVEAGIQKDRLENILWNLNKIGDDHGGNRAFGTSGYKASLDFVLERVVNRFGKHLDTFVQPFDHLFHQVKKIQVKGPDGAQVYVISLQYNPGTPLPDGITGELVHVPYEADRGSGCFEDQWKNIDAQGKVALLKRGGCAFADMTLLAKAAGAKAVIFYNNTPGKNYSTATLQAKNVGKLIPSGLVALEDGEAWAARVAAGDKLSVTLVVDAVSETRETWNIISETKAGDKNNVVMLGAHLDSVLPGPGVNDDGSGTAALLEIIEQLIRYDGIKNTVRVAWWGAEESGLIGSLYYGSNLTEAEADRIKFYFNYDMIGSPHPEFVVYANDERHKFGGAPLFDYLQAQGKPAEYKKFGSSSDYVAFLNLGIPSSGLFTGASPDTDPCYHQACDTVNNINWDALTVNTKAAARVAAQFALSLDGVPPRNKTTINPRSKRGVRRAFDDWADAVDVAEKTHNCGSGDSLY
ncbi:peptidase M28 family protein [Metarhizium robertsii]|uniref:Peptide hydrolase n=2 Tax=Metarhizium robertsii TaxID=568076 RepID=E9F3N6_METRA|nr:peptidase family M28 [Metarhizium robertsii ARSEF 23]EFY97572.1 peptidase family M28 [Metarhizium robertsii ARSEF 23]EXV05055.1 peptidase M28 family protein [Metarhizium robertsii]